MILHTGNRTDIPAFYSRWFSERLKAGYVMVRNPYNQYWFVTITCYGKDIEPNVPEKSHIMQSFKQLSSIVGANNVAWRYDPIFIDDVYTLDRHFERFNSMASQLSEYTNTCVISFIDLYEKVKRNFPEIRRVSTSERLKIGQEFSSIGKKY